MNPFRPAYPARGASGLRGHVMVWALCAVVLSGCDETKDLQNFTIPAAVRQLHVRTFENNTYEMGIEDLITHKTIEEILKDAQVSIVDESEANAVLRGTVQKYVREPIAFDQNNVATLYRIYVVVRADLINPKTQDLYWVEPIIDHETTYSTVSAPIETEAMAKERLAALIATDLLTRVTQGWINIRK